MKLFAVHKDGKLEADYWTFLQPDIHEATIQFVDCYEETPKALGVELVEYVQVNTGTDLLLASAKEALETLKFLQSEYSDLAPRLNCHAAISGLRDTIAYYEATK